jgi:hypothetical protein
MPPSLRPLAALAILAALQASPANAWTRPGHMVTAVIAYDVLRARDPKLVDRIVEIASHHPDTGAFEVAAGRSTGEERARRVFLEMARWPDDARGGAMDHPTWHYAQQAVADPRDPPPTRPGEGLDGNALEAFALNARVAGDPHAAAAERAVALCWVLHLMGDIHQPLHTAQQFSGRFPKGDRGGGLQYVIDPQTGAPISLHWFWDDSVNRLGDAEPATTRARTLEARMPRASFPELASPATPDQFPAWRAESYALAGPVVYRDVAAGASAAEAKALGPAYVAAATAAAERRVTLAGYRLADVLAGILALD